MLIQNLSEFFKKPITGCIHIGAHHAEEKSWYSNNNINEIVWIEANQDYYDIIQKEVNNDIIIISGVGNKNDEIEFNVSNNGQSSSFLELGTHINNHSDVHYTEKKIIKIKKMESIYDEFNLDTKKYNFLNMDIQGYELEALKGFGDILENFDYVYTEINVEEVYKGCPLVSEIDDFLKKYSLKRVKTEITPWGWGDALYIKN
jgi:FkbM family methyltransferase